MHETNAATICWPEILSNMFNDPRFKEARKNCWSGDVNGTQIRVVLATMNPNYNNFALNKPDLDRLLAAKRGSKIDHAFVVAAKIDGPGAYTYWGSMTAEEMQEKLLQFGIEPRQGRYGDFHSLPATFFPPDDFVPF